MVRPRPFGVCEMVLGGGDLATDAAMAADAGVAGISVQAGELLRLGPVETARLLSDVGLVASSVMAIGGAVEIGAEGPVDAAIETLEASAAIGASGVLVVTGPRGGWSARDADQRCRDWLARLAPRAVELGLVLMVEPMYPMMRGYSYVHSFSHALDIVAPIEGASIVVDTGHLWWDPHLVELVAQHVDRVGTVQLTNISTEQYDKRRYARAPFDSGEVPLRALIEAFDAAGYRGWYEHEVLAAGPDDRVAFVRESREWFDAIWS